jgi:hypothetical protein
MATPKTLRIAGALLLPIAITTTALAVSCSSGNSNPQPQVPVYTTDSGSDGGSAVQPEAGGGTETGSGADTGGGGEGGGGTPDASNDGPTFDALPDVDAAACTSDAGCWSCPPSSTSQFLNQCTNSTCSPFDNGSRVPSYDGGALPPLP